MSGRVAGLSCVILLIAWPAHGAMGSASSAPPRSIVATDAAYEPSHEQPQRQGDDAQTPARNEDLTTAEGTADPASREATPLPAEPFGLKATPVGAGSIPTKWRGAEAEIHADWQILARCQNGAACPQAAQRFLAIVAQGRAQHGRARIGVINRAINLAIKPMSDLAQWGVIDRWSAPLETFTTGRGDCEDYAIAKYVALTAAGVAAEDIKLVVVRDTDVGEYHVIVAVRLDGAWLTLDNRWLVLIRDGELPHAIPLFVLDENGVRQLIPAAAATAEQQAPATASF
jgi:predicted transglutaminase-like cysteine proteinase